MRTQRSQPLSGKLVFETPAGAVLSEPRIRLLEAIALHGSLSRAAKDVPLSYKAAWDTLDAMNKLSESPLVVRTTGGQHGGGTQLTAHGRQIVALYRAMESSQQDILNQLAAAPQQSAEAHKNNALRTLIRRMSVKTSARNQFEGRVMALEDAGGMVAVHMQLTSGDNLVASITRASLRSMVLSEGAEAYALVKAPWVAVSAVAPKRHPARNVFSGEISQLEPGEQSTQVTLVTRAGLTVTAALTNATVAEQGLAVLQPAWASFATDSVILATFA